MDQDREKGRDGLRRYVVFDDGEEGHALTIVEILCRIGCGWGSSEEPMR
jgi:hypothetical protein